MLILRLHILSGKFIDNKFWGRDVSVCFIEKDFAEESEM